jgi:Rod binding domain-containing protein
MIIWEPMSAAKSTDAIVATAGTKTNADAKLKRAAGEFEAMLLSSWLEKMRESYGLDDQDQAMPGSDNMTALATQAVASAIASRGGLGIAKMMYERLRSTAE